MALFNGEHGPAAIRFGSRLRPWGTDKAAIGAHRQTPLPRLLPSLIQRQFRSVSLLSFSVGQNVGQAAHRFAATVVNKNGLSLAHTSCMRLLRARVRKKVGKEK